VRTRAADHGERPGPVRTEAGQLLGVQLADPRPVKVTLCGHTPMLDRPAAARGRRATVSAPTAYLTCLRQHGVNVPTARPTVRPTARPTGGFGAGSATMQKARQACASLRPAGGFGFGGGQFAAAFQAFRTCMASHGVTIPTTRPTAPPTRPASPPASGAPRIGRFLNGLNPDNPKVAAAVKACQSRLPTFPRPAASPSAA
jgi:hypothetical protein